MTLQLAKRWKKEEEEKKMKEIRKESFWCQLPFHPFAGRKQWVIGSSGEIYLSIQGARKFALRLLLLARRAGG